MEDNLYFTDEAGSALLCIENAMEADGVTPQKIISAPSGFAFNSICIKDNVAFALAKSSQGFKIFSFALQKDATFVSSDLLEGQLAWLYVGTSSIKVLVNKANSWVMYEVNDTSLQLKESLKGTVSLKKCVFVDDAIVYQASSGGYIQINRGSNGQTDISEITGSVSNMTASGNAVMAQTSDNKFYWFNAKSASFATDVTENLDLGSKSVKAMGSSKDNFVLLLSDGSLTKFNPTTSEKKESQK